MLPRRVATQASRTLFPAFPVACRKHDFMTTAEARWESERASASTNGTTVTLSTKDVSFSLHASWLWVNDPLRIHPTSGQRTVSLGSYSSRNRIVHASIQAREPQEYPLSPPGSFHSRGGVYQQTRRRSDYPEEEPSELRLEWATGEVSLFDMAWLIRCGSDSLTSGSQQSTSTRITKDLVIGAQGNPSAAAMPRFSYDDFHNSESEEAVFKALLAINKHGAILVDGAPANEEHHPVTGLGKLLSDGRLSHGSLYGDYFHVKSQANANNIAYTSEALPPHQDLTYYESKPFLQLLHCVHDEADVVGGESILVDAMAAAEYLEELAPHVVRNLCDIEATFLKQRDGADMVSFKPHIQKSKGEVVAVHWSPPFEGPVQGLTPDEMVNYLMSYQAMECMLDTTFPEEEDSLLSPNLERSFRKYARDHTWERSLQSGEILVFNNQRMVHGRKSFSLCGQSPRHMIGCYTDAMETMSRFRVLLRNQEKETLLVRNPGNGSRGTALSDG